jgi:hypothetical protein
MATDGSSANMNALVPWKEELITKVLSINTL